MIKLPQLNRIPSLQSAKGGKTTIVVQWNRKQISYLVAAPTKGKPQLKANGTIERELEKHPLAQLAAELQLMEISCKRLVVLLSRADLEVATMTVPPSTEEELPAMVGGIVEQEFGENEVEWVVDYVVSREHEDDSRTVLTFTMAQAAFEQLRQVAKQHQFQLDGVLPRSMAGVALLSRAAKFAAHRSVAISFSDGQIDMAIMERSRPIFLRSLRSSADDSQQMATRLSQEIKRCFTSAAPENSSDASTHLYLFGAVAQHQSLVESLADELSLPVSLVNPLDFVTTERSLAHEEIDQITPLLGAVYEVFGEQPQIDLCRPRKAPTPASPWRRWSLIGSGVAVLIVVGAYYLWSDRMALQVELAEKQAEFDSEAKLATKMLQQVDDAKAVEAWMEEEVNWLDELRDLSDKLPSGELATIRRVSGTTQSGGGSISLSVQVSDPEQVARFESGLRTDKHSVTSNRVSERTGDEEYPWQFDTRLIFERRTRSDYQTPLELDPRPQLADGEMDGEDSQPVTTRSARADQTDQGAQR